MVEIKEVVWTKNFEKEFKKVKDKLIKEKIKKQIIKIIKNPDIGKPLRFRLKGERTVYVKPYRMIYTAIKDKLYLLRFEHRGKGFMRGRNRENILRFLPLPSSLIAQKHLVKQGV